jgi:hypothetical protein
LPAVAGFADCLLRLRNERLEQHNLDVAALLPGVNLRPQPPAARRFFEKL